MPKAEPVEMTAEERAAYLEEQLAQSQARNAEIEARNAELEAEKEDLELRRAAAVFEPENDAVTIDSERQEARQMDAYLERQKKFTVFIPVDPRGKEGQRQSVPVQVNGSRTYIIVYGEDQIVPEEIYLQLVGAGLVRPQRQQDFERCPKISVRPGVGRGHSAPVVGG